MEIENLPIPFIENTYDSLAHLYAENSVEPTERDIQIVEEMSSIACTPQEICGVLKLSPEIFKTNGAIRNAVIRGQERSKVSLRRLQWKTAQKNLIMQIFLGKQMLGQADKVEHSNDDTKHAEAKKSFENKLKKLTIIPAERTPAKSTKRTGTRNRKNNVVDVGEGCTAPPAG